MELVWFRLYKTDNVLLYIKQKKNPLELFQGMLYVKQITCEREN